MVCRKGRFVYRQHTYGIWCHVSSESPQLPQNRPWIEKAQVQTLAEHRTSVCDRLIDCFLLSQRNICHLGRSGTTSMGCPLILDDCVVCLWECLHRWCQMQRTYLAKLIVLPGWYPLHLQYRAEHASTLFLYCAMVCMLIAVLHGVHSMSSAPIFFAQLSSPSPLQ